MVGTNEDSINIVIIMLLLSLIIIFALIYEFLTGLAFIDYVGFIIVFVYMSFSQKVDIKKTLKRTFKIIYEDILKSIIPSRFTSRDRDSIVYKIMSQFAKETETGFNAMSASSFKKYSKYTIHLLLLYILTLVILLVLSIRLYQAYVTGEEGFTLIDQIIITSVVLFSGIKYQSWCINILKIVENELEKAEDRVLHKYMNNISKDKKSNHMMFEGMKK